MVVVPTKRDSIAPEGRHGRGIYALLGAVAFVVLMVVFVTPTRIFLLISIPIGLACAAILRYINKRPVELSEEENKRPLGL